MALSEDIDLAVTAFQPAAEELILGGSASSSLMKGSNPLVIHSH
ncbi:hypothetical protein [Nostoc sp. CHAB 5836]|nr:hypothetical protein [Nostoc sp. CHAB 5836]